MAINFVRILDGSDDSIRFQPMERLNVYLFGAAVLFASWAVGLHYLPWALIFAIGSCLFGIVVANVSELGIDLPR